MLRTVDLDVEDKYCGSRKPRSRNVDIFKTPQSTSGMISRSREMRVNSSCNADRNIESNIENIFRLQ